MTAGSLTWAMCTAYVPLPAAGRGRAGPAPGRQSEQSTGSRAPSGGASEYYAKTCEFGEKSAIPF